ncbi:ABC transporter permease [Mycobacterium sp. NPDC004974]
MVIDSLANPEVRAEPSAPARRRRPLVRYALRRLGLTAILAVGITVVSFLLTTVVPINAAAANLGDRAASDPEVVAAYEARYGLDRPPVVQYFIYLKNLLQGDLGMSQLTHRPVVEDLGAYAPATLELVMAAVLFVVVVGVALGTWAALRRNRFPDQLARIIAMLGVSTPIFWLGLVASFVFFAKLGWLPSGGRLDSTFVAPPKITGFLTIDSLLAGDLPAFASAASHLVLPSVVLGVYTLGLIIRFTRTSVLEVLGQDYVRAAEAKGLSGTETTFRYILRAAAGPIITVTGVAFGTLLAGTVLIETVFNWPGLGQYAYHAATAGDLSAIMGVSLFVSLSYILINLVVDLLYMALDPRVRLT